MSAEPLHGEQYMATGDVEYIAEPCDGGAYLQADGNDLVSITDVDDNGWGTITVFTSSDPNATVQWQGRINVRERRNMEP